jgi:pimeloyl-ACP methyl ester carboxylesterase
MTSLRTVRFLAMLSVALLVSVVAVSSVRTAVAQAPPWFVDEGALPFNALAGATAYWGVNAGAGYRIEVPDNWNGDLVLYAHGFRGARPDLFVTNPSIRSHLIANGYAWAASSYSANGYAPGVGARDTHNLLQRFNGLIARPDRVYIMGHSMGGHVTALAIEQWPRSFDGALPLCGVMGDSKLFDYFLDVYLVAETLVHGEAAIPTPPNYASVGSVATRQAMGPSYPSVLNETGERFKAIVMNLTGGPRPVFHQGWLGSVGGNFIFTQATTGAARQNVGTIYRWESGPELTAEEQAFNDLIVRIKADPQYVHPGGLGGFPRSLADSPRISGNIRIPVLSMHTLGELFVPFHMQQIYAHRVGDHGKSDLLVQRAIRDTGHCGFSTAEQTRAFDDLVNWVVNGVKPAGDNVLDPAQVAHPSFGCQFTTGFTLTRLTVPSCP